MGESDKTQRAQGFSVYLGASRKPFSMYSRKAGWMLRSSHVIVLLSRPKPPTLRSTLLLRAQECEPAAKVGREDSDGGAEG